MTDKRNQSSILVWDAPVRVFHWLLVLSFAGAYITSESERWRLIHTTLGYTMAGLLVFRLLWGLVGTRHARFTSFVRGPAAVVRYIRSMVRGAPAHFTGHNPAGAVAIVLMLMAGAVIAATGWATYNEIGGEWLSEVHEGAANFMLAVVGVHVVGMLLASRLHRENLARAMVTGRKRGATEESARWSWWPLALALFVTVLVFWWLQWQGAPIS